MKTLESEMLSDNRWKTFRLRLTGMLRMMAALGMRQYPDYIYKRNRNKDFPVFTFHHIDESRFRNQLDFLRLNGYETVQTDALLIHSDPATDPHTRRVMLTFDDGTEDLYRIVFPILREYGMKAVAFICPFWIDLAGVVSWPQVREMHESGVIDFQSHSYSHRMIEVRPKIVDFYHPRLKRLHPWDLPIFFNAPDEPSPTLPPYGTPIRPFTSGMGDEKALYRRSEFDAPFQRAVQSHGEEAFFGQKNWRKQLMAFTENSSVMIQYESEAEQNKRIRFELEKSKAAIEARLPGKEVTAFAYPNHVQGHFTSRLLREIGYRLVFGGIQSDIGLKDPNRSYSYFKRVSADFLRCLEGNQSQRVFSVMRDKSIRGH